MNQDMRNEIIERAARIVAEKMLACAPTSGLAGLAPPPRRNAIVHIANPPAAVTYGAKKRCSTCKAEKLLEAFHKHSGAPDRKQAQCKACTKERDAGRARVKKAANESPVVAANAISHTLTLGSPDVISVLDVRKELAKYLEDHPESHLSAVGQEMRTAFKARGYVYEERAIGGSKRFAYWPAAEVSK